MARAGLTSHEHTNGSGDKGSVLPSPTSLIHTSDPLCEEPLPSHALINKLADLRRVDWWLCRMVTPRRLVVPILRIVHSASPLYGRPLFQINLL
jgi:hypothetical protein